VYCRMLLGVLFLRFKISWSFKIFKSPTWYCLSLKWGLNIDQSLTQSRNIIVDLSLASHWKCVYSNCSIKLDFTKHWNWLENSQWVTVILSFGILTTWGIIIWLMCMLHKHKKYWIVLVLSKSQWYTHSYG